jgi:hypothetical protein
MELEQQSLQNRCGSYALVGIAVFIGMAFLMSLYNLEHWTGLPSFYQEGR